MVRDEVWVSEIFVATLAGVSSKEKVQLRLWNNWQILAMKWEKGEAVLGWKGNRLNDELF